MAYYGQQQQQGYQQAPPQAAPGQDQNFLWGVFQK